MKKSFCWIILAGTTAATFGQGSLTPPGPPAPTMRTLLQIEPRTPISSLPFSITAPGSYFLATNLIGLSGTNGVTISSSSVTLDLRGFTLTGVPGSLDGIATAGTVTNVIIENGALSRWGGNDLNADSVVCGQFLQLNVTGSGLDGLDVGQNSLVRQCTACGNNENGFGNLGNGFQCTFEDCISSGNGGGFVAYWQCSFLNCRAQENVNDGFDPGYQCTLRDCTAGYNGNLGIWMPYAGCVAVRCVAANNGDVGIATDNAALSSCTATFNNGNGFDAGSGSSLADCVASYNGGQGFSALNFCAFTGCSAYTNVLDNVATGFGCTLAGCSAGGSETGNGFALGSGNTITGSTAFGNSVNGIDAGDRTTVRSCTATFNGNAGIHLNYQGTAQQCTAGNNGSFGILSDANGFASILENNCSFNGILAFGGTPSNGAGIYVTNSPGCRIEGNTLDINYAALVVAPNLHAFVLRNSAYGNVITNYSVGAGNDVGPIGSAATSTSPWANLQ